MEWNTTYQCCNESLLPRMDMKPIEKSSIPRSSIHKGALRTNVRRLVNKMKNYVSCGSERNKRVSTTRTFTTILNLYLWELSMLLFASLSKTQIV